MSMSPVVSPSYMTSSKPGELVSEELNLWKDSPSRSSFEGLNIRRGLRFLRRNWLRILSIAVLVTICGMIAAFLFFNKYVSTALILVDPRDAKVTQATEVLPNIGPDSIAIESLVQVANSDGFMSRVIDEMNLVNDDLFRSDGATEADRRARTLEKLKSAVRVERRGMTYVIEVTAATKKSEESGRIANKVAEMIVADQSRIRFGSSDSAATWITDHIDEMRDRLHTAEEAAAALKAKLKVTDAGQGFTLQERLVSELNQQLVLASARTAEARAKFEQLQSVGSAAADTLPGTVQSPVLSSLRQDYARLTRQAADQATVFGDRHPDVQALRAQIADNKRQTAAEIKRMIGSARSDFNEAQAREASLSRQVREAQSNSGELGRQIVKLGEVDREAKAQRSVYEQLLTRQKELTELRNLQPSEFRIVSTAVPPLRTNMPKLPLLALACSVLGLMAGLGYAAVKENMSRTVMTQAQAERLSGLPVVGLIPMVRRLTKTVDANRFDRAVGAWVADFGPLARPGRDGQSRVVLVTSAKAREGKSVVASHLAASLAGAVENVLLVDAGLPARAKPQKPGLVDVLRGTVSLERVLTDHPSGLFSLLPLGRTADVDPDAIGVLLGGPKMADVVEVCRELYGAIVIDCASVSEAPYISDLAALADVTLLVVEWNATDQSLVSYATERLHAKAAAVVINKVELGRYSLFEPLPPELLARRSETARKAA